MPKMVTCPACEGVWSDLAEKGEDGKGRPCSLCKGNGQITDDEQEDGGELLPPAMTAEPDLEAALAEMVAVFKKHNVAGCVGIVAPTSALTTIAFPDWSTIQVKGQNFDVQILHETAPKRTAASLETVSRLCQILGHQARTLKNLYREFVPHEQPEEPRIISASLLPGIAPPGGWR